MMFDVIVFPFHDWKKCQSQGLMRRDTQIILGIEKISDVRRILVVDRPVTSAMLLYNRIRGERSFVKGGQLVQRKGTSRLYQMSDKLYVLNTVLMEPFTTLVLKKRWWPYIMKRRAFLERTRDAVQYLRMDKPILWLFTPISSPMIGRLDERLVVFDALDNWVEHEGMAAYRQASRVGYEEVRTKADLAFCGSKYMQEYLSHGRPRTFWVPNAVDASLFTNDFDSEPAELTSIPRPRIGYVGFIDSRVDIELIEYCARRLPNASFVLVGPVANQRVDIGKLQSLPNTYFLGHKRYEDMPAFINSLDVCLVPHKVNAYTEGMNPLKVYEYLACGKPIVSTAVAGIEVFSEVVSTASSAAEFADAIGLALMETAPAYQDRRRKAVTGHSWPTRLSFMWAQVHAMLDTKGEDRGGLKIER